VSETIFDSYQNSFKFALSLSLSFSPRRREYLLKFDDKFEVQDDFEVLKRMGLLLGEFF
jgi:hypothetical protein